jgi:hypothetical protein
VKTYIEELLTTFSGFHQTIFSFLTAHSLQQLFPQLTAHSNFFHSHSPTKQTLNLAIRSSLTIRTSKINDSKADVPPIFLITIVLFNIYHIHHHMHKNIIAHTNNSTSFKYKFKSHGVSGCVVLRPPSRRGCPVKSISGALSPFAKDSSIKGKKDKKTCGYRREKIT